MLTVYRASAGSGKTYKLTGEYLMLLFSHPAAYRRILAVTFTNKATEEMKGRIIEALYNMAVGRNDDYIGNLKSRYRLSEESIREQARRILVSILHDYSSFNVSTIDRFFQQTMRAFTREIGLQGGYGIEMDQELVLTEAVDRLLRGLDKPENKDLLGWLIRFAEDKIENGGEWNLRHDIMGLSREIFKEKYKTFCNQVSHEASNKAVLKEYKKSLLAIIHSFEAEAQRLGQLGLSVLQRFNLLPSDFKGGSRSPAFYLEKLIKGEVKPPSATFISFTQGADYCYTKTTPVDIRDRIQQAFNDGLDGCFNQIITLFSEEAVLYNSAKEVIRYYYTLGILTDISHCIAEYREEKNVMLIADTTELLHRIIDDSDAPFIYEKTGTRVNNYMIDEFQDTSGMQWKNFLPLVRESLSAGHENLIVGDVKQSIYRFRNSDWNLLDEQIQKDFNEGQIQEDTLKENWRSAKCIVDFNNALFCTAPSLLQCLYNDIIGSSLLDEGRKSKYTAKILKAYDSSSQLVAAPFQGKEGHVRIEFIGRESEDGDKNWKDIALERLPLILEQLQNNGYNPKDIAILTRTNSEGAAIAEFLLAYKETHPSGHCKYDIISDEALFVNSSKVVRFLVAVLNLLCDVDDNSLKTIAYYTYRICTDEANPAEGGFDKDTMESLTELSGRPLYEAVESVYRLFEPRLPNGELAFIQAFFDMASEYTQKESSDISRFIKWWDEYGCRKAIATPDGQNAIRILTIHKSKGLGFKAVLIPFADWEIDHKPNKPVILWGEPDRSPFDKLHLIPVRYGQGLGQTIFAEDYFEEKLHAYIDNLNTLYVAFTRAEEELLVLSPRPEKMNEENGEVEKVSSIANLLWAGISLHEKQGTVALSGLFDRESGIFDMGTWWSPKVKEKKNTGTEEIILNGITSVSPGNRLRLRLHGREYYIGDAKRKHGALMHEILSHVITRSDIPKVLEEYRQRGIITDSEGKDIRSGLEPLFDREPVKGWFDGTGHILNETDILYNNVHSRRPDRIIIRDDTVTVVDYKFGEKEDRRYHLQIKKYMHLIKEMGYSHVNGFVWYVELDKIEEVIFDIP